MEKMRQWMVLTALGVVGVLAAGWFLMVSPQRSHASSLRTAAASEQQSTAGVQSQVAQLKQQQKGEPAQQRRLAKIGAQVPDNPELPTLIRELSAAAHDAGVSLDSLTPSQPTAVTVAAPAVPTTGATTAAVTAAPLNQIPVTIAVSGSYFNVESFMHSLEHLDRALMTTGLTLALSTTADSATGNAPNAITGQISAVVFESPVVAPATTSPQVPVAQASAAPASTSTTTTPAQSGSSE